MIMDQNSMSLPRASDEFKMKMLNKRKTRSSNQSEYERQRQMNIEKNAMRFQELGLSKLANQLVTRPKDIERDNHAHDEEDQEYIPEENGDDEDLLNIGEEHAVKDVILTSATNCISNKVRRVTTRRRASIQRNQPSCPAMSIAEFLDQQKQQ
ncbi:LOW QUALITY PROTEIN: hypothetical protein Cgig2_015022 [Carnegiea gigantea]|uniref:Uncharacterized protein n=1 Tax=Carnegiea gigantea TaxID=171969 RepID=A0A9Q1JRG4_9CARY|nr:LOW QUALITY PROTEIN: hypothetical protein Cgig2_015022 [Carnegiea gigantea]